MPRSLPQCVSKSLAIVLTLFTPLLVHTLAAQSPHFGAWITHTVVQEDANSLSEVEEEEVEFLPGLLATYSSGAKSMQRVDPDIAFQVSRQQIDARLPVDSELSVRWEGMLETQPGTYILSVFAQGEVAVFLNGREILSERSAAPKWMKASPVELAFGRHDLRVEHASVGSQMRIGLYWSGDTFQLEPISSSNLSHHAASTANSDFARGQQLARGLRCVACHALPGEVTSNPLAAPALTHLKGNLRPSWLTEHLTEVGGQTLDQRRMPYFGLQPHDAAAISAALLDASNSSVRPQPIRQRLQAAARQSKQKSTVRTDPDPEQGHVLFASVGCIACHRVEQLGRATNLDQELFSGGDLTEIAAKRTDAFLESWLQDPASINAQHRMPLFALSTIELADLTAFLSRLSGDVSPADGSVEGNMPNGDIPSDEILRGKSLVSDHRCGSCHVLPAPLQTASNKIPLNAQSDWQAGCLNAPNAQAKLPGFQLSAEHVLALQAYFQSTFQVAEPASTAPPRRSGQQLLVENNCLACHSRDGIKGIESQVQSIAKNVPELNPKLAALTPPTLTSIGDKLHEEALRDAIARKSPVLRDWLEVRMPRFRLTAEEMDSLTEYLISHDRIPHIAEKDLAATNGEANRADPSDLLAASRLVTSDGFGCQSCHAIGDSLPPQVDLKARGAPLSMLGNRLRREWFLRWVRDPSRIVPRMEMPAIKIPVQGLLAGSLDRQLEALWSTLNSPGFQPPKPNPTTIVRAWNSPQHPLPPQVLTDVIEAPDREYLRPVLIGFTNRHNLLIDLERVSIASWWLGDTAFQQTRGKTWYWEPGNAPLLPVEQLLTLAVIDADGQRWIPQAKAQFPARLKSLVTSTDQVQLTAAVDLEAAGQWREMELRMTATPLNGEGISIHTQILGLEPNERVHVAIPFDLGKPVHHADKDVYQSQNLDAATVSLSVAASSQHLDKRLILASEIENRRPVWQLLVTLESRIAADEFPYRDVFQVRRPVQPLRTVPGYEAVQLGLPIAEMPISLAWDPDENLYVGSLKGNVLQASDTDGDGLEDTYQTISANFPTPYGIQAFGDHVDVLTKFGLVRLTDRQQGRFQTANVLFDDWGYTHDYHDWAVGLEMDANGNYYIAIPCQQDDRSPAAAHRRGTAIKLIRYADAAGEVVYRAEQIAAGLRFPMGIALNQAGDLFTTDNQGNYNPFNELNHLRTGKRYGFINKLENKDGFSPPFEEPAINVPHPWTRSVNGICFLTTPSALREQASEDHFGPFEGHLIGCEMNGQSLIRMSLQKVGDTYQGAAYPFSQIPPENDLGFEGPIVCEVSPKGDLYVGSLQDSGWGGGQNTGSIVRLRPTGDQPVGIAEVRATPVGLEIEFTRPVNAAKASKTDNYQIRSYTRTSTPAYGGDDHDSRTERIRGLQLSEDRQLATIELDSLRAGFVYEINLLSLADDNQPFFPASAHYSMRSIP
ncbi:MAG: c-type cytochrome [Planctomycetales bacterium]|nr:c-type cytochrome [Planctomycetales bacterium]